MREAFLALQLYWLFYRHHENKIALAYYAKHFLEVVLLVYILNRPGPSVSMFMFNRKSFLPL